FATLEEPYQRTLFLRFFDDRTPAWIAAEDGVPVETVKTRLKRGLAKLRAKLDERNRVARDAGGPRGSWRATALALARDGAPLLGIAKGKGAAAAAAVFVVASAVTWWRVERRMRPGDAPSSAAVPVAEASSTVDERTPPAVAFDAAPAP